MRTTSRHGSLRWGRFLQGLVLLAGMLAAAPAQAATAMSYWTEGSVRSQVAMKLEIEAMDLASDRRWWADPVAVLDWLGRPMVFGESTLVRHVCPDPSGALQTLAESDDRFMALRDAASILAQLQRWSVRYGISWVVEFDGEVMGRVSKAGPDVDLKQYLAREAAVVGVSERPLQNQERARRILGICR